ncbi:acyl-CoA thioesterase [Thiopseudomonas alkaliphila]|uniref:acyl-CoA thioesterase n=1 Tax=Thiopseudomonas alkaliphila TaxID=1697053 RepID=UPI00069E4E4D|nr:thioesterase family protein [Thiopseudomonas alkaliphila]AKX52271.1 thioesterase [Thiopseudomonas alkaliphila]
MNTDIRLEDFPLHCVEKLRFRDTDSQGHVNNAVFVTLLEVGRVEMLFDPKYQLVTENSAFVLAHLSMDYLAEMTWPGEVTIGTCVVNTGRSSLTLAQGLFQNGKCVATAKTVMVLIDIVERRPKAISDAAIAQLAQLTSIAN